MVFDVVLLLYRMTSDVPASQTSLSYILLLHLHLIHAPHTPHNQRHIISTLYYKQSKQSTNKMADSSYNNTTTGAGAGAGYGAGGVVDNRTTGQKVKGLFADGSSSSTGTGTRTGNTTTTTGHTGRGATTSNGMHTTTQTTAPSTSTTEAKTQSAASSVGGVFAGIHGAGEKIRGEFNAGVDRAFNEPEGAVKNKGVANAGEREIETGHFSGRTREKELGSAGGRRI